MSQHEHITILTNNMFCMKFTFDAYIFNIMSKMDMTTQYAANELNL